MARIRIVGTSHIAPESVEEAERLILSNKPDCVAVELDPARYQALSRGDTKPTLAFGLSGFLMSYVQHSLSKRTGSMPGSEMLAAIEAAREVKSRIVLIDMDIRTIMQRLGEIPLMERLGLVFKMVTGYFMIGGRLDLKKVPEERVIDEAMKYLKREAPQFYRILVTYRKRYMADWVKRLSKEYRSIIVVVGAGHEKGLRRLLRVKG